MLAASTLQTIALTSCIEVAEHFYSDVLGLPLKGRSHGALVYDVGGSDLRVSPVAAFEPSSHTLFGFAVADIAAAMASLSARGLAFERFPSFAHDAQGVVVTPWDAKVAWFRDPDGNILSIVEYGAADTASRGE